MKLVLAALLAAGLVAAPALAQQKSNSLTWATNSEIETFDPYATAKRTSQQVIRNVLENLIVRVPSGKATPALATSWKWVNPTTLELALRRGVTFHDGSAFSADDVVYTVDYVKKPENNISFGKADYGFIKGAAKVDDFTVHLLLEAPTPSAIEQLTQVLFILPKATHEKMGARAFGAAPVGTGPFKVEKLEPGRQAVLVRNDKYYAADWGKPRFDKITVVSIVDTQTQVAELTSGRVDFLGNIQPDQVLQLKSARNIDIASGQSVVTNFLLLDSANRTGTTPNPMQDKNVRLAISHGIDRLAIAKTLRGEASEVIPTPCHPKQFGCVQDVVKYAHDVKKAKEYLAKSAFPKGFEVRITAYPENGPVAEAISGELRGIGIEAKSGVSETSAWVKELFGGKALASVISWPSNGVYDVVALVPLFFQGDQGDYSRDAIVMDAFKKAATLTDEKERLALYKTGFDRLANEALVVPLMTGVTNFAYRKGLDFALPADGYAILYMSGWK